MPVESNNKEYALVYAANNAFGSGFLVSLASVLSSSNLSDFQIYFLHDSREDVSELQQRALELCARFNFPASRFQKLKVNLSEFEEYPSYSGNHLAYARMFAIRELDEDVIVYLDCDTFVLEDISLLVGLLGSGFTCAAIQDEVVKTQSGDGYLIDGKVCVDDAPYFNSGVLILNKCACQNFELYEKFRSLVPRLSNPAYADQSYLNVILRDNWTPIPDRWNRFVNQKVALPVFSKQEPTSVLHYVSPKKPWSFPNLDSANILWHSVATSIDVAINLGVTQELSRQVQHLRIMKNTGLSLLEPAWYGLMKSGSRHKRRYMIRASYAREFHLIDPWLMQHGFEPVPESLRLEKNHQQIHTHSAAH